MADDTNGEIKTKASGSIVEFLEIQRAALGELLKLAPEVVLAAEEEIEQRYRQTVETDDREFEESAARIESRWRQKVETAEREHAEEIASIESEYAASRESLAAQVQQLKGGAAAEFAEVDREARRKREDDLLMADTVVQATIKGLRQDFHAAEHRIAVERERLKGLDKQAEELLREYRIDPTLIIAASGDADVGETRGSLERHAEEAKRRLDVLRALGAPRLFVGAKPVLLLIGFCAIPVGGLGALSVFSISHAPPFAIAGPVALVVALGAGIAGWRALRRKAIRQVRDEYTPFRRSMRAARRALDERLEQTRERLAVDEARAEEKGERDQKAAEKECADAISSANRSRSESLEKIEAARAEREAENGRRYEEVLNQAIEKRAERLARYGERHDSELEEVRARHERKTAACRAEYEAARSELELQWRSGTAAIRRLIEDGKKLDSQAALDWETQSIAQWSPPREFAAHVCFGRQKLNLREIAESVRRHTGFPADGQMETETPALLALPEKCSMLLQTERAGRQEAIDVLRAVMLRLLTSLPPGRVHFTIIDPVGLGENFAGFMHLGDYEEALVGGRIWTESEQIESRLTELTGHMENVIQKYLRNEFETIDEYNVQAGEMAEPYRFLVIADFPANFNEGAARRLGSIVNSGARCGVFTLIAHDRRLPEPQGLRLDDLEADSVRLVYEGAGFVYQDDLLRRFPLALDASPSEDTLTQIMHVVGSSAKDSLRVEVPFASSAPPAEKIWSASASDSLSVPLGRSGAVRLQRLRLGRGIAQHALVAGKTGSGKSTLLHVIITNLALWYSPDEVEFYLVDFKKGVEFKTYVTHQLPHARAIAIESDREFGVSVLQRLDAEMERRGELFRAAGVQDLPAYREATGQLMPRTLLIVDEFQVFFSEDDRLSQDAAILLDRLVRQGRAFGIHVLLGSQTLGGAASLARSTMGQMAVRIALHCSEADSQLILDDTNVAARLLTRPGEAIYNDAGGLVDGNSPFQTAWLPDEERAVYLENVCKLARERGIDRDRPIVFEGGAPADIRQNRILARLLEQPSWPERVVAPRAWLGEAVAIKDPTSAVFKRQSGANLLIVGQRDDAALALCGASLACLASQYSPRDARFVVLDGAPADAQESDALHKVAAALPHDIRFVAWRDVGSAIGELADEIQNRLDEDHGAAQAVFLVIYGLQRYRMLRRQEEDFSFSTDDEKPPAPDKQFADLLREGPPLGVHAVIWSDTLATLERTLDRQTLGEFDNRVLFQLSAADSSNLIDTPEANKLGYHRALLYSEERGMVEKFRPYGACDAEWLADLREKLAARSRQ